MSQNYKGVADITTGCLISMHCPLGVSVIVVGCWPANIAIIIGEASSAGILYDEMTHTHVLPEVHIDLFEHGKERMARYSGLWW